VEAVVFECLPEEAARQGLCTWRCDLVAIVPVDAKCGETDQTIDGIVAAVRAVPASGAVLISAGSAIRERVSAVCRGRVLDFSEENLIALAAELASTAGVL
jgi:hypothetical protein